jgi:acetyl esterase/lipase
MKSNLFLQIALFSIFCSNVKSQEEIKLYPKGPTDSNGIVEEEAKDDKSFVTNITEARMYAYPAPKELANGTAVLICPGGGYRGVSIENEGSNVALWLNKLGVSAFVLYYRMPNQHSEIPLTDAQTAIEIIRNNSKKWNVDAHKIGIMGFSAGGHLASTVGTHFSKKNRPDFMILGYPVISMKKEITHAGSRKNLLGENPTPEMEKLYSNELQVTKNTPPTFIVCALDDKAVLAENSYLFHKALQAKGVSSDIQTYELGGHGFGMRKRGMPVDNWTDLLEKWLVKNKFIIHNS